MSIYVIFSSYQEKYNQSNVHDLKRERERERLYTIIGLDEGKLFVCADNVAMLHGDSL